MKLKQKKCVCYLNNHIQEEDFECLLVQLFHEANKSDLRIGCLCRGGYFNHGRSDSFMYMVSKDLS